MTAALTERYIAAAIRGIPPASRDDVQAELDVSIADAIEARTEQGAGREDAERVVLTDLGDPEMLAAGYADRPLHLIGPRFYLTWWRLLKLLWIIVPVAAMSGSALGHALSEEPVDEIIGSTLATGLGAFVHVTFWVTLVFAVLERTSGTATLTEWDVDQLPEMKPKGAGRSDLIASLIFVVLGVGALLWDRFRGFVRPDSEALPILNPDLWPWWIAGLMVLIVAEGALMVAVCRTGRWTPTAAMTETALTLVFAVPAVVLLAAGQLVSPVFIDFAFTDNGVDADTLHTLAIIIGAGLTGLPAWQIIDAWRKTIRDNRR